MDILLWIVTGGLVGWVSYARFGYNEARGRNASIILGAFGAFIGAKAIAPLFLTLPAAGELSIAALVFAAAAACGVLALGNAVANRWGI